MKRLKRLWKVAAFGGVLLLVLIYFLQVVTYTGLQKYKSYGIGLFDPFSSGYSSICLDKTTYETDDVICITVSTAFFDEIEDAKRTENIKLYAVENEVFDISFGIGQPYDGLGYDKIGLGLQETYWMLELPCEGVSPRDLVYNRNIFNSIKRKDFGFSFNVYLKVKENAPENFTGSVEVWGNAYAGKDSYGNRVGGHFVMDYLYFSKQGDQIVFK